MFTASMSFDLGEDIHTLQEHVHRFAQDQIKPLAAEVDRSNEFPGHLWKSMGDIGVLGVTVDEEFGGVGLGQCEPVVWCAFQSLRQSDSIKRHPGAKT